MKFRLLIIFVFLFLSGCFSAATISQPKLYSLNPGTVNIIKSRNSHKTLLVSSTRAVPTINTSKIMYVTSPYGVGYFTKHKWASSPARQLTPLIVTVLQKTRHFNGVVAMPFVGQTDYRLDTRIMTLKQVFIHNKSFVLMVLDAEMINSNTGKIIAEKRFRAKVYSSANNPVAGVVATNTATKIILQKLARFVVSVS